VLRISQVLREQGRKKVWLAGEMDVTPAHLSRMLAGSRVWTARRKALAVKALDWRGDPAELFRVVDGVKCPRCGGMGKGRINGQLVRCDLCRGEGQVTRTLLREMRIEVPGEEGEDGVSTV